MSAPVLHPDADRDERVALARNRARLRAERQARAFVALAELIAVLAEGLGDQLGEDEGECAA